MIFVGLDFSSDENALNETVTHIASTKYIVLKHAIFDDLYLTHDVEYEYTTEIPEKWTFDTVMRADFNGDLAAGNVDYSAEEISEVLIKRRPADSYQWTTLFSIPIETADSFHFEKFDRYARSQTDYVYALVPVAGGIEGKVERELNTNTVHSEFDGVFIMERDSGFSALANVTSQINKNHPTLVVAPIHRKYPYVFGNGNTNYYSGSLSAIFVPLGDDCLFDFKNGWKYRDKLLEFLCNGQAKILKLHDGRMWMVNVVDSPSESVSLHEFAPHIAFSWVEIDDCDSGHALYENNFIDADYDLEVIA